MYFSANNQVIVLQLESLEDLEKVSSEQQRDALHVELGEVSGWLMASNHVGQ
jgi:hypothetical protein